MRKTLLAVGLVAALAFAAGLGVVGTLAATDGDSTATVHPMGVAAMPGKANGAMSMQGMGGMGGMSGMPTSEGAMAGMHSAMPGDVGSMDAMHAAMSAQMPDDARAPCDEAHARMNTSSAADS